MRRSALVFALPMMLGLAFATTIVHTAWSAPGSLLSQSKINNSTLPGQIDDGDELGDSVANLGDLDGPGPSVVALAVGAVNDDDGGAHRGAVYILFLNAAGSVLSYQKISLTQGGFIGTLDQGDELGGAVTSLGDLDGPGPSKIAIAVGAAHDDDGGLDRGAIYILFLNSAGMVLSQQKISDTEGNFTGTLLDADEFGGSLAGLGDLDGPGGSVAALATGAVYDAGGGFDRGAVYILFLNSNGTVSSHRKIADSQGGFTGTLGNGDNFGEDVAPLGDLDGPGASVLALAVGTVGDGDGGSHRGAVYILFLWTNGTVISHQKISSTKGNFTGPLLNDDNFGTAVASLGDLDGPGPSAAALAVGAGSDDGLGLDRGAVYILLLNNTGTVLSYQEISSTIGGFAPFLADTDEFGSGLAALGDINGGGAGAMTLASGVSFDDDGGPDRGAVYLLNLDGVAVVGVQDPPGTRRQRLGRPQPNLFSQRTTIPFRIERAGRVRIEVWDASGRLVRRLLDNPLNAGDHQTIWDGTDESRNPRASGTYFVRMSVDGRTAAEGVKAVLLR
jgi:flagellar hook capping protein FlgD